MEGYEPAEGSGFVHLRVHSDHSLLEGMMSSSKICKAAAQAGMPAVAITNRNNLFNALEFSSDAAASGVQPIIGCAMDVFEEDGGGSVVLLAQGQDGWSSLCAISQRVWMREHDGFSKVRTSDLAEFSDGVICLSGGAWGPAGNLLLAGKDEQAREWTARMADIFPGRFYIEIQRHLAENGQPLAEEQDTEPFLLDMAYDMGLPIVASNDARFLSREHFRVHDALICVGDKTAVSMDGRRMFTPSHHLASPEEMRDLFRDLPEACDRTLEVAMRCAFKVPKHDPILPVFAENEVAELRQQAVDGLKARLAVIPHSAPVEKYEERLDFELGIIQQMGFPGYFLIVADFIKWAKQNDIPVGPGRGSGAGSLVAYALTITDLDPLRYNLLFERFLNPERVSMPDFDIDFCMSRRDEVIEYVRDRYGDDKVGQIITFGGLLSKAAVQDVGRVLGVPYGQALSLSKMIPVKGAKPLSVVEALKTEPRLAEMASKDERVADLFRIASVAEGASFRSAGTHAAGVVIADRPLHALVPVYRDSGSKVPATQFNMAWVEKAGLVKFDFLGLKTLTVIRRAIDFIEKTGEDPVDISMIPIDDRPTYDLMAAAETVSVFQIESPGMMDALRRMKPTCIEDIIALVALYRPGPMENIPTYCEVKNGIREIQSIHPEIDPVLKETQGIIVYQEQVMQIAQILAGYTLGGADLLRRAMGKKKPEEMAKERPKFIKGCFDTHQVPEEKAGEIFDLLEKFANYGFNKSHAAAYALISYQTAWLKTHHPIEFMAGVMSCDIENTDKLEKARSEMSRMGIDLLPPDINRSDVDFRVADGAVIYALAGLKGVGVNAVSPIVEERERNGRFSSIEDLAFRVDLKRVGRQAMSALAKAGAFGSIIEDRATAFAMVEPAMALSDEVHSPSRNGKQKASGDLFDNVGGHGSRSSEKIRAVGYRQWSHAEAMANELEAIGFHLSGHPLDDMMPDLANSGITKINEIERSVTAGNGSLKVAGVVVSVQEKPTRTGGRFSIITISDPSGNFEISAFGDAVSDARRTCQVGERVVMNVRAKIHDERVKVSMIGAQTVESLLSSGSPKDLWIEVPSPDLVPRIAQVLGKPGEGRSDVFLVMPDGPAVLVMEGADIGGRIIGGLEQVPGVRIMRPNAGDLPAGYSLVDEAASSAPNAPVVDEASELEIAF